MSLSNQRIEGPSFDTGLRLAQSLLRMNGQGKHLEQLFPRLDHNLARDRIGDETGLMRLVVKLV